MVDAACPPVTQQLGLRRFRLLGYARGGVAGLPILRGYARRDPARSFSAAQRRAKQGLASRGQRGVEDGDHRLRHRQPVDLAPLTPRMFPSGHYARQMDMEPNATEVLPIID